MVERSFVWNAIAIYRVHDLQLAISLERVPNEVKKLTRFGAATEEVCSANRHCGVTGPRITIVPIALAADPLWYGSRWRRNHRPGRGVHQKLEEQPRADDVVSPRPIVLKAAHPIPPSPPRPSQRLERTVDEHRLPLRRVPTEHQPHALASLQGEDRLDTAFRPRLPAARAAEHRHQPLPRRGFCERAGAVDLERRVCRTVAESWIERHAHQHFALDALNAAVHLVHCGARVVGPRHVVGEPEGAPTVRAKERLENVGARIVALQRLERIVDWTHAGRATVLVIEQRAKHARAIEAR